MRLDSCYVISFGSPGHRFVCSLHAGHSRDALRRRGGRSGERICVNERGGNAANSARSGRHTSAECAKRSRNLGQTGISVFKGTNGVTFIRLKDPTAVPSNVLRSFKADGKVYAIDRNGIIFGGPHQVNTGALAAAAMDATSNSQTKQELEKHAKPVHTEAPSIITTEIVGYGK